MKRLSQRGPRAVLTELGPQQREHGVAPMRATRTRRGEIHQQGEPLGLHAGRWDLGASVLDANGAERREANHGCSGNAGNAEETPRQRSDDGAAVAWRRVEEPGLSTR